MTNQGFAKLFEWKWRLISWWRRRTKRSPTTGEVMVREYFDALGRGEDPATALVYARNAGKIMEQKPPPITGGSS